MTLTETWLPVVGWEGLYEVSDQGRVKSLARRSHLYGGRYRNYPEVIRSQPTHREGYKLILLTRNRCRTMKRVHMLVLTAFKGPCPPGMVSCHNDGNPANNRLDNLRWDTQSSNIRDSVHHGRHVSTRKTHCKNGHEFTAENTLHRKRGRVCRACERKYEERRRKRVVV
jgi:hypothetical protein